jgi:hypothetical protein
LVYKVKYIRMHGSSSKTPPTTDVGEDVGKKEP